MRTSGPILALLLFAAPSVWGQQHELGLTLGALSGPTRTLAAPSLGTLDLGRGLGLQVNYGYRLTGGGVASLSFITHFLASGQRLITATDPRATTDIATAYVTPGLRVKFLPARVVSPWVEGGGGYALYEQSRLRADGQPNDAGRFTHRGALMFGGGVDVRVRRWLALRAEVRDFYTGNPGFNLPVRSSGQHNVVVGGGFVVRWGR